MMTHVTEEGTAAGLTVGGVAVRRQDRHRRDRRRGGHQPALVHRLRAGRRPADRGRGDARALPGLLRRRGRRPDRDPGDGERCWRLMALEPGQRIGDRYTLVAPPRRRRDGGRLARRRRDARPPGRAQVPARALRPGRPVRRALPPRGAGRRRPPAPERGRRLRPRRDRRPPLDRDGVRRGRLAQGPDRPRADGRRGGRDRPPDPRRGPSSRTSAGSSTATSSRRTCSSTARAAPGSPTSGSPAPAPRRSPQTGLGARHRPVPLARAGAGAGDDRDLGPLLDRGDALRGAHRPGPVRGRLAGRGRAEADLRAAAPAVASSTRRCRRRSTRSSCGRSPRTPRTASSRPTSSSRALDAAEVDPLRRDGAGRRGRRGAAAERSRTERPWWTAAAG